jgi:peptide/nickel transport system permease protein
VTAAAAEAGSANQRRGFVFRLLRQPVAIACIVYLGLLVVVAIVAPIALPDIATQQAGDLNRLMEGPSSEHLLGTDSLGRDLLHRLLVGTQPTLVGIVQALAAALLIGVPVGLAAGYWGGVVDRVVGWFTDMVFAMPNLIVILVVVSIFTGSSTAAMVTFGVIASPTIVRVVRSAAMPIRSELYIDAARVAGLPDVSIIWRHVLPRIAGPVIVQASILSGVAVLVQLGLAFLNLVVPAPAPSWGGMMQDGWSVITTSGWVIIPPGVVATLTIVALGLLGDAVRDATTARWAPPARRRSTVRAAGRIAEEPESMIEPTRDALLRLTDVRVTLKRADGSVPLVDRATFDVRRGETVAVVGESGCGKTITAKAILGLLPAGISVAGGSITFDGRDLATMPEKELRRIRGKHIGFVSQDPMVSLNPSFRVGWQLAEVVRRHNGLSRRAAHARVLELLGQVDLPDPAAIAAKYPHELSGGMAQRICIARALAGNPELLIADEPTTALDVTLQAEILALLRRLQSEFGMGVLIISHDWGVVADIAERVIVMYAGQVVERGPLLPLFRRPLHPYTKGLLAANPHHANGADILPSIRGNVPAPGSWPHGCHFEPRCGFATTECATGRIPFVAAGADRETRCVHAEPGEGNPR